MLWIVTIIIATLLPQTFAIPKCCQNDNIIVKKICSDGSNITTLACPRKYIAKSSSDGTSRIDAEDNLILHQTEIAPDRYCISRFNGTNYDIYLICFDEEQIGDKKFLVNGILLFISVIFILLTIAIYCQLPDLLDLQGICILHSISGLGLAFLTLGISQLITMPNNEVCLINAYLIYFCSLYSFFWLNTLSFHIWRITIKPRIFNFNKYWTQIYHIFAIGCPTVLLIFLVMVHHSIIFENEFRSIHPGLGENKCWFNSTKSEFIYFYGPLSILICLNIIYYTWTIVVLWKDLTNCDGKNTKVLKYRVVLCAKLFIVMGITWIFEILSAAIQDINDVFEVCWLITDAINALQGILIFLILVVFRKRVIRGLANRTFCGKRLPNRWRTVQDNECDEIEEEFGLSETQKSPT